MRVPLMLSVALLGVGWLSADTGTTAPPSTVIDQTYLCSVDLRSGVRSIGVSALSGFREPENPRAWRWLAAAEIEGSDFRGLLFVAAGAPHRPQNGGPAITRWLAIDAQRCVASRTSVPLSPKGLTGGEASQLLGGGYLGSDAYRCKVPSKVLIRSRAVFRTPTTLTRQRRNDGPKLTTTTAAVAREAAFAIRTPKGKPIAFADVRESGKGRLFAGDSCLSDH